MSQEPQDRERIEKLIREDLAKTGLFEETFDQWRNLAVATRMTRDLSESNVIQPLLPYAQVVQGDSRLDDDLKALVLANSNAWKVRQYDDLVAEFNSRLPGLVTMSNRAELLRFLDRARQLKIHLL